MSADKPRRPDTARPRAAPDFSGDVLAPTPQELLAIESERLRWVTLLGASVEPDEALGVTLASHYAHGTGMNFAAAIRWPESEVAMRLAEVESRMRAAGTWPQLIVASGLTEPADLADQLLAAGWIRLGKEQIMYVRQPAVVPHLDPGLRIEAVTPATALECARLETAAFGLDPNAVEESASLLAAATESGAIRAFIVRLAREPIASARLVPGLPNSPVASLHAIAVAARHRRRGYGRLVTTIATRAGLATGHALVWLSVDEDNFGAIELYRTLGYDLALTWSRWAASVR
ncbi:MAG: GNAT family N-acetyltransferase [Chloroflexota bacterium]